MRFPDPRIGMNVTRGCSGFDAPVSLGRRDFLTRFATGLGGIAFANLLGRERHLEAASSNSSSQVLPQHPPKAKRAIQIFLQGGLSQVDSFDYKPDLARHHGKA